MSAAKSKEFKYFLATNHMKKTYFASVNMENIFIYSALGEF